MGIHERREREREARRKLVLDAARELVREHGLNGTTTKRISERCELSEATLFWYFKNKDEIFTSLLFEGADFMSEGISALAARRLTPKRKLNALWKFFGTLTTEHPEYFYVFSYVANPQSLAAVSDEIKHKLTERTGDNFRQFVALLDDVGVGGNTRLVADVLWATFTGLVLLRESRRNLGAKPHPNDREFSAALKLVLSGIAPNIGKGGI